MPAADRRAPYDRKAYLGTVSPRDRDIAERLCRLLEKSFSGRAAISLYGGFPVAMRDGEWLAGFAMRARSPVVYLCAPAVHERLGAELEPFMSGKSCLELRPRGKVGLEELLALVARAYRVAARSPGLISKADARKRDAARAGRSAGRGVRRPRRS